MVLSLPHQQAALALASEGEAQLRSLQADAARLQLEASRLGEINFLTDGEAQATSDMNDQHLDRPWQMWVRRVRAAG